jgi:type IV secretion system protein VirB10
MDENHDESEKTAKSAQVTNLLSEKKVLVTRFNRKLLSILLLLLFLVVAASLLSALSPRRKLEASQDSQTDVAAPSKPSPPRDLALLPGDYSDLAGTTIVSPKQEKPTVGDEKASPPGEKPASPVSLGVGGLSPKEALARAKMEERQKEKESAQHAPVNFPGMRGEDPPCKEPVGSLPELSAVLKMANTLTPNQAPPELDQNLQTEKRGFAKENRDDFPYLKTTLLTPLSPYEIKAGTIIPGVLLGGINSDLPGQIVAQVSENVFDTVSGRYLLVPQGSRLIGEYDSKISYGEQRVLVIWTRIIMPNGNSIGLEGMPGVDLRGYAGIGGEVNNHYAKLVSGVVLGSLIGAGAQVAVGGQGSPNTPASFSQMFVAGAAGNTNQAAQQITQKNLNLQPTIEIPPGQRINVVLTKDMILKPYVD